MKKYWMAVVSREHVQMGVNGSFAMLCHGKEQPLRTMSPGDSIIYYSPTEQFGSSKPYQKFTALGTIQDTPPTQHVVSKDFTGWKRETRYTPIKEVPIKPLILTLSFIKNKKFWGMPFRRGLFSLPKEDFKRIVKEMGLTKEQYDAL